MNAEVIDVPSSEDPVPGLRLIRDLRSFLSNSRTGTLPADRSTDWHCPACNVWGRDLRPAACWSCGTKEVDYRVAPSMAGGHRFHETHGQEGA